MAGGWDHMGRSIKRRELLASTTVSLAAIAGCGGAEAVLPDDESDTAAGGPNGTTGAGTATTTGGRPDCESALTTRAEGEATCELEHSLAEEGSASAETVAYADLSTREQCIFLRTLESGSFVLGYRIGDDVPDSFEYEAEPTRYAVTYEGETHHLTTATKSECPAI